MIKVIIEMEVESVVDFKGHMSIVREQVVQALKSNFYNPESPIEHLGMRSNHTIKIENTTPEE